MRSGGCRHESGTALDAVVVIQSDGVQGNFSCGLFFFTSRESLRREKMAREADDEREAESTFD